MVDVIDQSWVHEWITAAASPEAAKTCCNWIRSLQTEWHPILQRVPPLCLVRGERHMEVPYPFTVGVVTGYLPDGRLNVQQTPSSPPVAIDEKDLKVVGYWKGLSPKMVLRLLPKRTPHAQHP